MSLIKRDAIDISTCELEGSLFTLYLRYTVDQEPISDHFLFFKQEFSKGSGRSKNKFHMKILK
jgi:hypothetical protein